MFFIAPALPLHWFQATRSSATTLMASEATIEAVLDNLQLSLNFPQAEASSYYIYSSQFLTLELNYNGMLQRTQFLPVIRLSLDSNPGPCENSDAHFLRMRLCNDAGCSKWSPKINVAQSTWLFFFLQLLSFREQRGENIWWKCITGPSGDDRSLQINVAEIPPDSVIVRWQSRTLNSHQHYFDLRVINETSGETTYYHNVQGNIHFWFIWKSWLFKIGQIIFICFSKGLGFIR